MSISTHEENLCTIINGIEREFCNGPETLSEFKLFLEAN